MGPRGDSDCDRVEILLLFSSSLLSFLFLFIFSIFRCSKYNKIRDHNLANNYVRVNARQREFESLILFDPLFSFRGNDSRNFPALSFPFFFFLITDLGVTQYQFTVTRTLHAFAPSVIIVLSTRDGTRISVGLGGEAHTSPFVNCLTCFIRLSHDRPWKIIRVRNIYRGVTEVRSR